MSVCNDIIGNKRGKQKKEKKLTCENNKKDHCNIVQLQCKMLGINLKRKLMEDASYSHPERKRSTSSVTAILGTFCSKT